VLNIRRKDPVNSATSWIDCAGFSSRFFEETIYYIGMLVPAKETSLNTRIHKPCRYIERTPKIPGFNNWFITILPVKEK
jgi:hypothetical protein